MILGIVMVVGGVSAMCLWGLVWGRPDGATASHAAPVRALLGHKSPFAPLQPMVLFIERKTESLAQTRWLRAMFERDTALIVQSGLSSELQASQLLALRIALALGALGTSLLVLIVWMVIDSLAVLERGPIPMTSILIIGSGASLAGLWWPERWLRLRRKTRERAILKALPFVLDLLTLSVESGASLAAALGHAADKGPQGPLRDEMQRMLQEVRAGSARSEALRSMAQRMDLPAVSNWVAAMVSAQQQGSSLGPLLRAQADQRREERFLYAEKVAMKAPVKMLFPLLVFIFPCTFLLLFFPVGVRLVQEGLLR